MTTVIASAPLSAAERDRIAANVGYIKAHLPGFVPFFKDLHELGMVSGWRDIDYAGPVRPEPKGVTADKMVLESAAEIKARIKHGNH